MIQSHPGIICFDLRLADLKCLHFKAHFHLTQTAGLIILRRKRQAYIRKPSCDHRCSFLGCKHHASGSSRVFAVSGGQWSEMYQKKQPALRFKYPKWYMSINYLVKIFKQPQANQAHKAMVFHSSRNPQSMTFWCLVSPDSIPIIWLVSTS